MKTLLTVCLLFSALLLGAQTSIVGVWDTGKENTKFEIIETHDVYSATILSTDNSKLEVGSLFLKDIKADGAEWKGRLYSFKKKKWLDVILTTARDNTLKAKVKAGAMKKKLEWTRVQT